MQTTAGLDTTEHIGAVAKLHFKNTERKKEMNQKRAAKQNENNPAQPIPLNAANALAHSAFVITIVYDPQSEVVNFNTVRQGDGAVYLEDQIKALRNTYEAFIGRLAIELHKAAAAQAQATK
jgi:hypothetical protein